MKYVLHTQYTTGWSDTRMSISWGLWPRCLEHFLYISHQVIG